MGGSWTTVRVFISSTFRDMHAERDHLVRVVFPELRERCAKQRLHLVDVDLRWGVTEEDAQRGKALEICLHEIEDCRPFFIGLLGERYGWIPPRYDIPDEEQFDTLRSIEPGHSITAMEIYQGVLNNPPMRTHAFFYFRDPAFIDMLPPDRQLDFRAEDHEHAEKLRQLKDRIRASGLPVLENYRHDDLEALGCQVLEHLWGAIEAEHPEDAPDVDRPDVERVYHDFFIETRTELFIGQRHLLARLHAFVAGDTPGPMVITGTSGCGKSALLARFVSQFRRLAPDTYILYHFVGTSPSSTDPRQMLRRLCGELARRFGFEDSIPEDWNELRVQFWRFLQRAAEQFRSVVVFDALNQLDETHRAHDLDWLPAVVPRGLRLIISSLEGDTLEAARRKYEQRQDLIVTSLRLVDQGFILARQLQQARKRLTTARKYRLWREQQMTQGRSVPPDEDRSQLRYILTGVYSRRHEPTPQQTIQRETANPLYLHLVAEELRLFGRFEHLADFIARLPNDVPGMFQTVLERLEQDHGRELVEHSLSLVATGRHGLLESELLDLLARPGEQHFPLALWSRLYRSLAFYLKPRASVGGGEGGLVDFFHRQLAKIVHQRYLAAPPAQQARHVELTAYFQRQGDPTDDGSWKGNYPRSLSEVVLHQIAGRLWDGVERTLTALFFLEANVAAGRGFDLAGDFQAAWEALSEDRPQRKIIKLLAEALRRDIHFIHHRREDYPQGLFQCLWNHGWWYDCSDAARYYHSVAQGVGSAKLCTLLERWRSEKESRGIGPWLRALRPPSVRLGSAQLAVLRGHVGPVTSVSFSSDGRRIASGSEDQTLRVWDAASGAELAVLRGHENSVTSVSFSPDGRRIASGSRDTTVRIWDAVNGAALAVLRGHEDAVYSVSFSPDNRWISSGSEDRTVRVWDAVNHAKSTVLHGHEERVNSVSFSPESERVASASWDGSVRIWDVANGTELAVLNENEGRMNAVAFAPDGWIATCRNRVASFWVGDFGESLNELYANDGISLTSLGFSPDSSRIATGSDDGAVWVWETFDYGKHELLGHEGAVNSVSFSPDGERVASGSEDGTVRVWDAINYSVWPAHPLGHHARVTAVRFSPDGRQIATVSMDKTVCIWDAANGSPLHVLRGHEGLIQEIMFSPDGRRIASVCSENIALEWNVGRVHIWDAASGEKLTVLRGHEDEIISVVFSPDGQRIASVGGFLDKTVRVWDATSGTAFAVLSRHDKWFTCVCFSPDSRRIASGSAGGTVLVWDATNGAELAVLRGHKDGVVSLSFSPEGSRINSRSSDKSSRIWDAETGECLEIMQGPDDVGVITDSAKASPWRMLSGGFDSLVKTAGDGHLVAFFPQPLEFITVYPSGRRWAGAGGNHLYLLELEGELPSSKS